MVSGDLEVKGSLSANIASSSLLYTMNNTASASHYFKSNGSGGTNQSQFSIGVGNGTERLDIFNNNNSPIVTIASTGNVGIGTTGPGGALHIKSTAWTQQVFESSTVGASIKSYFNMNSDATTGRAIWDLNRRTSDGVFDNTGATATEDLSKSWKSPRFARRLNHKENWA